MIVPKNGIKNCHVVRRGYVYVKKIFDVAVIYKHIHLPVPSFVAVTSMSQSYHVTGACQEPFSFGISSDSSRISSS